MNTQQGHATQSMNQGQGQHVRKPAQPPQPVISSYTLGQVMQLVDLNEGLVNFAAEFTVKSRGGEPFYLVVATQSAIDGGELRYQDVRGGEITASVKKDTNIPENYFLVLKADQTTEVDITIRKGVIAPKQLPKPAAPTPTPLPPKVIKKKRNWFTIAVVVVAVVAVGFAVYWFMLRKPKHGKKHAKSGSESAFSGSPSHSRSASPAPKHANPLLAKLKSLNLS